MKQDRSYIRIIFFIFMIVTAVGVMTLYNAVTADNPQVFTDVIKELTSMHGSNKTAERNLYYLFSIIGTIIYVGFFFFSERLSANREIKKTNGYDNKMPVIALCVIALTRQILYSSLDEITIIAMVMALIFIMVDADIVVPGLGFMFMSIYGICAVYRLYITLGGNQDINKTKVVFIAALLSVILLLFTSKLKEIYIWAIMVLQLIIPFILLIFLASDYDYLGAQISIPIPKRMQFLIGVIIMVMVVEAVFIIKNNYKKKGVKLSDILSYGSCISILTYNSYYGSGAIVSSDFHHPFENIIGYSQIFELSQKAFDQYIPVSGAYSILTGALFSWFGKGKMTYYNVSQNLFFMGVAILVIVVLKKTLVNKEWTLLVVLLFSIINYNRVVLILPIIILLTYPPLLEKKNLWLKVWFLSSLVHGLFYPLFGAAVCIGFLPLALYQVINLIRTKEIKELIKKPTFFLLWIICLFPAIISIPWLIGTFKHIKAMSDQTIYADGFTRYSQFIPEIFMPYFDSLSVRIIVFYFLSYIVPVSIVWVFVAVALKLGGVGKGNKILVIKDPEKFLVSISGGIIILISFSYTVIRMDFGSPYGRSIGVIYALFVFLIILIDRYIKDERLRRGVLIYAVFLICVESCAYFNIDSCSKLNSKYAVNENYQRTDGYGSRLGECFLAKDESVDEKFLFASQLDREKSYFAVGDFGYFYLNDLKGDGVMESVTVKGYNAVKEAVEVFRKNGTYIGTDIDPLSNYYLYNWLITSGEYIWDKEEGVFIPNREVISDDEIRRINKTNPIGAESPYLLRTASSWGDSYESLKNIFEELKIECKVKNDGETAYISFEDEIDGSDADFIYVEILNDRNYAYKLFNYGYAISQDQDKHPFYKYIMKKDYNPGENVTVGFTDDEGASHSLNCSLGRGKLLIPLGGVKGWLLNKHKGVELKMVNDEGSGLIMPEITQIRLLKLREIPD
ncbi:MAG: hypothetical protein K6E98_12075 [Lachnospiraceae bacterium]|nr:hypothetical protein [Lachnospiraceae bacterium]